MMYTFRFKFDVPRHVHFIAVEIPEDQICMVITRKGQTFAVCKKFILRYDSETDVVFTNKLFRTTQYSAFEITTGLCCIPSGIGPIFSPIVAIKTLWRVIKKMPNETLAKIIERGMKKDVDEFVRYTYNQTKHRYEKA